MVVALSQRHDPLAARTLRLAARLDGDSQVRETATMALSGHTLADLSRGSNTFWLSIVSSSPPRDSGPAARAALVLTASGLALPLLADPDGLVTACGLPEGPVRLRIAGLAFRSQHREAVVGASGRRSAALVGPVRRNARDRFGLRLLQPPAPGDAVAWCGPSRPRSGRT